MLAAALLLTSCSRGDPEQLTFPDEIDRAGPSDSDAVTGTDDRDDGTDGGIEGGVDAGTGDDGAVTPDDEVVTFDDPSDVYPDLPELAPDPASDLDPDVQLALLQEHAIQHEITHTALVTNDASRLPDVLDGEVLEAMVSSIDAAAEEGLVSRSPDSHVEWVRIIAASHGSFTVEECQLIGPRTGFYAIDDGSPVHLAEPGADLVTTRYELTSGDTLARVVVGVEVAEVGSCV